MKIIAHGRHPCVSCLSEVDAMGGGALQLKLIQVTSFISQHKNHLRVILVEQELKTEQFGIVGEMVRTL